MPSFLNTLGTVSQRGSWRFRQVLRSARADGRTDLSDDGLVDFSSASDVVLAVTPRQPNRCGWDEGCEPPPALFASLATGTLYAESGVVERLFPPEAMHCIRPGIYDVQIIVTIGDETTEIFSEVVEFA